MSQEQAQATAPPAAQGAVFAVTVLTLMNLLNYLDRWVPAAVKDLFKQDLDLSDAETSLPFTAFVIVYMLASPIFGGLADRAPRRLLIALGVALWSLATAAAALATGFWSLFFARALVGVGEAAYATIAPSLIADFYPPARRNRILTIFYVAIPVGSALGFTLGGVVGARWGWQAAFLVAGLPGLLAAGGALLIREPVRGAFEDPEARQAQPPRWPEALRLMFSSRLYVCAVAGYTLVTFATGGMADWFAVFLSRRHGLSVAEAGSAIGTVTVVGGLLGTALGGLLADRLRGWTRQPYLALSGFSMLVATVAAGVALLAPDARSCVTWILIAQFFLWFYNGPINALIVNAVPAAIMARAFSVSILAIHLLGDAISPPIIGAVSDATGSLPLALKIVPTTLGIGAVIWLWGWFTIPEVERAPGEKAAAPPVH